VQHITPWPVLWEQFERLLQHLRRLATILHALTSILPDVFVHNAVYGNYPPDMFMHSAQAICYLPDHTRATQSEEEEKRTAILELDPSKRRRVYPGLMNVVDLQEKQRSEKIDHEWSVR
jgi:hypothetical protein